MRQHGVVALACGAVVALSAAGCGTRVSSREQIGIDAHASAAAPKGGAGSGGSVPGPGTSGAAPLESGGAGATVVAPVATGASRAGVLSSVATAPAAKSSTPNTGEAGKPAADKTTQPAASGTPGATAPTPGATVAGCPAGAQTPIKVASIGIFSGVLGAIIVPGLRGLQAWVAATNARGGLACHPVKLYSADDGADPARNQALHKQMVEQEKVVAFLYDSSPLGGPASMRYIESKQIPVIGNEGAGDFFYDSPFYFPTTATGYEIFAMTVGAMAKAAPPDRKKLAIISCTEGSPCTIAEQGFLDGAAKAGFDVVYRGKASITQPDYTAVCLAARNAGAQLYVGTYTADGQKRLARNCQRVGLSAIQGVTGIQASLDFTDDPAMDGAIVAEAVAPWFDTSIPAVAEYQASLRRYAPDVPADAGSITGWTIGEHFKAAVRSLPTGPITSAGILEGIYSLRNERLGGLTYPLNSARGQKAERKACGWPVVVKGGKWLTAGDFFCL